MNLTQLQPTNHAASRASSLAEQRLKLRLHPEQTHFVSFVNEIAKARMVTENVLQGQVLGNLDDLRVENMTRIIGRRNLHQCPLTVGTARMRDVAIPAATFAEHSNRVKTKAWM